MILCPNCQTSNRDGANFCSHCGTLLNSNLKDEHPKVLQPGSVLEGRYRVIEKIGEGGIGRVYLGEDKNGRRYALKQIREPYGSIDTEIYEMYIRSFQREANILSSLPHPYLPIARDFIVAPEQLIIVMDFIEGRTLAGVQFENRGPVQENRVIHWAIQICDALSYLHQKSPPIIHRNIKPKNIILQESSDDHIRLIGFGLARHYVEGLERDEDNLGTAGYSPPEQYGHAQTDQRSDIYGLGATLFALLSYRDPAEFVKFSSAEYPQIHFPDICELNPEVTQMTGQVIMRTLETDPNRRYQSAEEMKGELVRIITPSPLEPLKQEFIVNQPVELEETRFIEFKEILSDDPISPIKRNIEMYTVAFLNSEGGRIFWGIRDSDRYVIGVHLDYSQRDAIRRAITDSLAKIYPPVPPSAYRIHFHPVNENGGVVLDHYVVEVEVRPSTTNLLYFTSSGEVYVKTESGKKRLTGVEIHHELIRRLQKGYGQYLPPDSTEME